MGQIDMFNLLYDKFKFDKNKPIRLFEAFSGIGTQAMALKRLGLEVEHVGISEVDKHAIKSYEAIHGKVNNFGGIGSFDRFPAGIDICTWSFPCQDLSLSGKQRGMSEGTRSNYGYVFLDTVENTPKDERPKVLLMENVKGLLSYRFEDDWREIQIRLERMGYTNYSDVLVATDYGIPQTRERVFVVSILGEYDYSFPKPFKLDKRLEDFLEDEVDEKYFLSEEQIAQIARWNSQQKPLENAKSRGDEVIQTITAKSNTSMNASMILIKEPKKCKIKDSNVRLLTPLEAWRLMGVSDEDFFKVKKTGISESQLYKQAGNAIVVDVLVHIFKGMIGD